MLNWYPKIQAMKSGGVVGGDADGAPNQAHLTQRHVAFLDLDRLYFELERFKAERGWYNLNLTRAGIADLLADHSWYRLLIPAEELAFDSFEQVRVGRKSRWRCCKKYTERYYTFRKREWELPHLEYRDLASDDPNFLRRRGDAGRGLLSHPDRQIAGGDRRQAEGAEGGHRSRRPQGLGVPGHQGHLVRLGTSTSRCCSRLAASSKSSPAPLNKGERRFVEDLKAFHDANPAFFAGRELYLFAT